MVCLRNFDKNVWVKNKDTILFTNHLGQKENSLKISDCGVVELSGKAASKFNETAAAHYYYHSCRKVIVLYYRQIFRKNELFVDTVAI